MSGQRPILAPLHRSLGGHSPPLALQLVPPLVGDAVQKRIAVVQAVRDKRLDQSLSSIRR